MYTLYGLLLALTIFGMMVTDSVWLGKFDVPESKECARESLSAFHFLKQIGNKW